LFLALLTGFLEIVPAKPPGAFAVNTSQEKTSYLQRFFDLNDE
jgi:hypothetical protein